MKDRTVELGGGRTAYRDAKVPKRVVPLALQSLRLNVLPGEQVLGLFAVTRLRRSVTMLVITDRRLLTLGDEHVGLPVVDAVLREEVTEVSVEREKIFSTGQVVAHTVAGEVGLGTLTYGKETFNRLEEILAAAPPMPVIPVLRLDGPSPQEAVEDVPPRRARAAAAATHPLVVHLSALADLHGRGALTDEEFVAAKARLLERPQG